MKVSIIIAVYNSEVYLEESINSVLEQTFTDFELLLIDDGSKDGSLEICKQYEKKDKRIRVIHKENQGVSSVRNLGISMSRGEYLRFFDADDTMPPESLERLVQAMDRKEKPDLVIGRFESNDEVIFWGDDTQGVWDRSEMAAHFLRYARTFYYGVMWNKLYRADIIRKNQLQFKEGLHWSEDLFFNLLYMEHSKKICYIKDSVCIYHRRRNSLSGTGQTYNEVEQISIEAIRFEAIYQYIVSVKPDEELLMRTYDFLFLSINQMLNFILDNKQYSLFEKYKKFIEVAIKRELHEVIGRYPYRNSDFIIRIMIRLMKRERYRTLFAIYYVKHVLKKNQKFTECLINNKKKLPKFPL